MNNSGRKTRKELIYERNKIKEQEISELKREVTKRCFNLIIVGFIIGSIVTATVIWLVF